FCSSLFWGLFLKAGERGDWHSNEKAPPAGAGGVLGEELAIRAVTGGPADWKGTQRIFAFGFEAGGVDLRPTSLRFPDGLLRVFDRPLLREIAINGILAVAEEQNDFVSATASTPLKDGAHRSEEIRVPVRPQHATAGRNAPAGRKRERPRRRWLRIRGRRLGIRCRFQGENLGSGQRLAAPIGAPL